MELHYRSYGAGPPLVILHGLFGSLDNWATLARRWADQFHVWTLDARNHGRSFHDERMDYPSMADDLGRFMTRHGMTSAHLLGHSMGGKTVMQFAATFPGRVQRLIVVDVAPRAYPRRHDRILDALLSLDPRRFANRKEADDALGKFIDEAPTRQLLLKNLAREDAGGFRWKMHLEAINRHYDTLRGAVPEGTRCDRPALFVRGGRSSYIGEHDRAIIKARFPHAVLMTVRNAGHWVHADAQDDLYQIVMKFLLHR